MPNALFNVRNDRAQLAQVVADGKSVTGITQKNSPSPLEGSTPLPGAEGTAAGAGAGARAGAAAGIGEARTGVGAGAATALARTEALDRARAGVAAASLRAAGDEAAVRSNTALWLPVAAAVPEVDDAAVVDEEVAAAGAADVAVCPAAPWLLLEPGLRMDKLIPGTTSRRETGC